MLLMPRLCFSEVLSRRPRPPPRLRAQARIIHIHTGGTSNLAKSQDFQPMVDRFGAYANSSGLRLDPECFGHRSSSLGAFSGHPLLGHPLLGIEIGLELQMTTSR